EPGDPEIVLQQQIADYEAEPDRLRSGGALHEGGLAHQLGVAVDHRDCAGRLRRAHAAATQEALELLRGYFEDLADQREKVQDEAAAALEAAFDFMEDAFGESQEMVVFVTELTVSPAAHTFIAENGCQRYFRYNKELLLDNRKAALDRELAAEEQRHGAGPKG